MEHTDYLFTAAEVGVAFAGFAGLVTVVAQRLDPERGRVDTHLLQSLLLVSLIAVGASMYPYVIATFAKTPETTWRLASGLLFVSWLVYYVPTTRRIVRLRAQTGEPGTLFAGPLLYVNMGLHVAMGLLLFANAVGLLPFAPAAAYLLAIGILLYMAGFLLFRLFTRLASP